MNRLKEQVTFFKRLAFLLNAGIPLVSSLHMLTEQTRAKKVRTKLNEITTAVARGQSFSKSLGAYPRVFSPFVLHIIAIGEQSGTLGENLLYLSDELRKRQVLRRKIIGASVYPLLITLATLGITAFLMLYLFPKIMPIFTSLHIDLPFTTKVVMGTSILLRDWGLVLFVCVAVLVTLLVVLHKKWEKFRTLVDAALLRVPVVGGAVRHYNLAMGARTLGLLLKSGVPLSQALPITAQTTEHKGYKAQYVLLAEAVCRGEKISTHLVRNTTLFPNMFSSLTAVGESSGSLAESLMYLSGLYESEVDDFTKNLATILEPVLMITMGLIVGLIAISIITPIYGITQNLHN